MSLPEINLSALEKDAFVSEVSTLAEAFISSNWIQPITIKKGELSSATLMVSIKGSRISRANWGGCTVAWKKLAIRCEQTALLPPNGPENNRWKMHLEKVWGVEMPERGALRKRSPAYVKCGPACLQSREKAHSWMCVSEHRLRHGLVDIFHNSAIREKQTLTCGLFNSIQTTTHPRHFPSPSFCYAESSKLCNVFLFTESPTLGKTRNVHYPTLYTGTRPTSMYPRSALRFEHCRFLAHL